MWGLGLYIIGFLVVSRIAYRALVASDPYDKDTMDYALMGVVALVVGAVWPLAVVIMVLRKFWVWEPKMAKKL